MTDQSLPPKFREFRPAGSESDVAVMETRFAGIGAVVFAFGILEEEAGMACGRLLGLSPSVAETVTSEMSFKAKLALIESVYMDPDAPTYARTFNALDVPRFKRIVANCRECEARRNQLLRSAYRSGHLAMGTVLERRSAPRTAKSTQTDKADYRSLLTVAEFIHQTGVHVHAFFAGRGRSV